MPFEIRSIRCSSHKLKQKRTNCQAVGELDLSACMSLEADSSIIVLIDIATIHMPRMLVEDNGESRACMVSFYPEFQSDLEKNPCIFFLLDCSNSMKERFSDAKKLLILMLHRLFDSHKNSSSFSFNVIKFGTAYKEMSPFLLKLNKSSFKKALDFVSNAKADMGNTDMLSAFNQFIILGNENEKNLENFVLISDGHFSRQSELFAQLSEFFAKTNSRIFACGLGNTANVSSLKILARIGNGSYEVFDSKSKWNEKVLDLLDRSRQPQAIRNVRIEWQNFKPDSSLQAPHKIDAIFNGKRLVAYGFVSNCFQATLRANIQGIN